MCKANMKVVGWLQLCVYRGEVGSGGGNGLSVHEGNILRKKTHNKYYYNGTQRKLEFQE